MNNRIKQILRKQLSNYDLKHILGPETKIITYPELSKYNSLEGPEFITHSHMNKLTGGSFLGRPKNATH